MSTAFISGFYDDFKKNEFFDKCVYFIILFYCFTPFVSKKLNSITELFLGLFFLFLLIKNPFSFRKDKITILFYLALIIQIITWVSVKLTNPEFAYHVPKIDRLAKLFLFIPIAWGLRKFDNKFVTYLFITAISGFFLGIVINPDFFSQILSALKGYRIDFGIRNAQHSSMIFGIIFIVCFLNLFVLYGTTKKALFFFVPLIILAFIGLVLTQTRQSYLAVLCVFLLLIPVGYFMGFRLQNKIILLVIILLSGLIFSLNFNSFIKRSSDFNDFSYALNKINSNDKVFLKFDDKIDFYVNNIPDSSYGVRLKSILESFKWVVKKPFLGWGSDGRSLVINESKNFSKNFKDSFGHLHNYFFEVLVSYGILGLSIIVLLYYFILKSAYETRNLFPKGKDFFLISVCFVSYWFVINNFESFNSFWTGVFVHNIACGCIYSRYLYIKKNDDLDDKETEISVLN
jgi:O-antigen ligase